MIGIEKCTVYINVKADDPYFSLSCKHDVIHGNICPRTAERSLQHHTFFDVGFSIKKPFQSRFEIFEFYVCQITQCPQIDTQKRKRVFAQVPGCADQRTVSSEHEAAPCICRNRSRENMSVAVFFRHITFFSVDFYIFPDLVCDRKIRIF